MAGTLVAVAIGGGSLTRDAFLRDALRRGAHEALWIDASLAWAERYGRPVRPRRRGRPGEPDAAPEARFTRRELVWPGEALWLRG